MHTKTRCHLGLMLLLTLALAMPAVAAPIDGTQQAARTWMDVPGWVTQWWNALTDALVSPEAGDPLAKDGEPADDADDATRHYLQIEPGG